MWHHNRHKNLSIRAIARRESAAPAAGTAATARPAPARRATPTARTATARRAAAAAPRPPTVGGAAPGATVAPRAAPGAIGREAAGRRGAGSGTAGRRGPVRLLELLPQQFVREQRRTAERHHQPRGLPGPARAPGACAAFAVYRANDPALVIRRANAFRHSEATIRPPTTAGKVAKKGGTAAPSAPATETSTPTKKSTPHAAI